MSYDAALEVRYDISELLRGSRNIVMVGVENIGGTFGVIVGATHPEDVEVPDELDNVPIRVIEMDPPSPYEPRD